MDVQQLEKLYLALLRHPHDSWRVQNQEIYVIVREALVEKSDRGSQEVQEYFEAVAAQQR